MRPPTQSHMGKRASQPFLLRDLVELGAFAGDGDVVFGPIVEARAALKAAAASSMPLRVSAVPPDLEITSDERVRERSLQPG